jgi:hypothetical protein
MRGLAALLTMRVSDLILRSPPPVGVSKPRPEEPAAGGRLEASS